MKKKDVKSIIVTAVSLFLICAVSAGLVAFVNSATKDRIADAAAAAENEARKEVLPAAEEFEEITLSSGAAGFLGKAGGETAGYVFTASANGYGGPVKVIVGFAPDGTVTGVKILTISETPGLGMKWQNDDKLKEFTGKNGDLKLVKSDAEAQDEIAAITGATITSKAMVKAVNDARKCFIEATEGKGA